ncbi:MAG: hypothetical protein K6F55_10525 [Eubacterium sp.]|nr:hypothetical protein [Eubacterium sp.]
MKKKVLMLLLIAVFVSVLLPKNTNVYADYSHSYNITGYLTGPVGDGILEEGAYYSFDMDKVINSSGNSTFIQEYNADPYPSIYFTNSKDKTEKYELTEDDEGIVYFYVPFDTSNKTYKVVFEFGDGYYFESDLLTVETSDKAMLDNDKKIITLNGTRLPLPGKTYADVSVAPAPIYKYMQSGGYYIIYSTLRLPVYYPVSGRDGYVTIYERWSEYMQPATYSLDRFEDNNRYEYEVIADFSEAGSLKNDYSNYKIETPNAVFDEVNVHSAGGDQVILHAEYTIGTDRYASKNLGETTIDLKDSIYKYNYLNEDGYLIDCVMSTLLDLAEYGMIGFKLDVMEGKGYYDLDNDGNYDFFQYYLPDKKDYAALEVLNTCSINGAYRVDLPDEVLDYCSKSQGRSFFESINFIFPYIPLADDKMTVEGLMDREYTGNPVTQSVVVKYESDTLKENEDYVVSYENNTNAGDAAIIISGKGKYSGTIKKTFKITKAKNPLTVKGKNAKVKYSKAKKKNQILAVSKVLKFTKKGQGKMSYKLVSVKGNKKYRKYIRVNSKTGKVTVKKGIKKGTYKVKVKVNAAGDQNHDAGKKNVTFKIIVK